MVGRHAVLAAILGGSLVGACARVAGSPSPATPEPTVEAASTAPVTATPATVEPTTIPTIAPTASPTASPVEVTAPAKPSGLTFETTVDTDLDGPPALVTQTVTWTAPRDDGVEIRVYGVTSCIARPTDPPPGSSGPCLVVRTPLPTSVRRLLATAPASAGAARWTWTEESDCTSGVKFDPAGDIQAVVVAAYGPTDHSIFAVAEPGHWWVPAVGDIIC